MTEVLDQLQQAILAKDFGRARDLISGLPPHEIARQLQAYEPEVLVPLFRILPRGVAERTFEYFEPEEQERLFRAMGQQDASVMLNAMAPDERTQLLEELPAGITKQLLSLLSPDERAVAVKLLGYPENSVGRLMTPEYIAVRPDWSVHQALEYIRHNGHDRETLNIVYVINERGVLIDDVRIRRFLLAPLDSPVRSLMEQRYVALSAFDDQETAVARFRETDLPALPVTDTDGVLLGIVTFDDVLDVAEAEATEDIQKIGGTEALQEPYLELSVGEMVRKRAGWLVLLFMGEMLTASAMGYFEHEIQRAVVLALFVPLIISSGGNSGSQAATLVIRAMALGEVTLRDWWRVMRREIGSGLALGGTLGTLGFIRVAVGAQISDSYGPHWPRLATTVSLTLLMVVLWGTLTGSMLPFLLRRLGLDPATSSAPFVATLVDVTGLVIYFSIAAAILSGSLL